MHSKTHPSLVPPEDKNAKIWRYMEYSRFKSILEKHGLFFAKPATFKDKYEGTMPAANKKQDSQNDKNRPAPKLIEDELGRLRPVTLISCWHLNNDESAEMWNHYSNRDKGIAIQSTYQKLSKSLDNNKDDIVYIGSAKYIDFDNEPIDATNIYKIFGSKQKHLEWECELSAITISPQYDFEDRVLGRNLQVGKLFVPPDRKIFDLSTLTESGKFVSVNLEVLIERIYVVPGSSNDAYEEIKSITKQFGLDSQLVVKSSLTVSDLDQAMPQKK